MKRIILSLFLMGGGYVIYRITGVYWMIAFIGLCLAFALTYRKLYLGDVVRLFGFAISFVAIMFGGAVVLARQWGEIAAGVWIFICVVF